jgi:hypothetical protein
MTTIAYDGRYIACDSRLSCKDHVATDNAEKFYENEEWVLFWSGAIHQVDLFIHTFIAKGAFIDEPEVWAMGFNRSTKDVWSIFVQDTKFKKEKISWKDGQGSGSCYAMGAMDFGASAVEAVKIAMSRDCKTGGTIRCFDTKTGKFVKVKQ